MGFGEPFLGLRGGRLTALITVAAATDMTLFGYDQAVFSGVVVNENFLQLHDLVGPDRTKVLSTVTAIYNIGCFIGAILAFILGERLGRKKSIMIGTAIMTVGSIIMTSSFSLAQMFVGRTILGIGNGINTATAPIWQTETSKASWRGMLVILEMMMNIAGFTLCNWINYGFSFSGGSLAWRFPLAFQLIFIFIIFATVPFCPESPRWLLAQGRKEEAVVIMSALENKELQDPSIITDVHAIEYSVQYERDHAIPWRQVFFGASGQDTKTRRRLLLGAGTQLMQQFQGINILSYYLPTVLIEYVGLSNEMARLVTAINATTYLIISCMSLPFIERWGRRSLMLISTAGQGLCLMIVCILLRYSEISSNSDALSTASIPFFFLFYISFGVGMLGIPWLYPTEVNSLPMRTKGAAVATATNWITNFAIVEITPIGIQNLGWQFWIVWTVFCAASMPIIYFLYPETANRTLEDLDAYYRENPSIIVTLDKEATQVKRPWKYIEAERLETERATGSYDTAFVVPSEKGGVENIDEKSSTASH